MKDLLPGPVRIARPVRFDVWLPIDMAQDMEDIQQMTGFSRGEIFRRAITLYKRLKKTQLEGGNVILRDSSGGLRELVGF